MSTARVILRRPDTATLLDRIDAKIDKSLGAGFCWPWTGATGQWGQPRISLNKHQGITPRVVGWEALYGPVPEGKAVTVTCERPGCMNPLHWSLRAYRDDAARFWEKVLKADGDACWEWKASLAKHGGYAQMKRNGKKIRASRFAYELENGAIGDARIFVCHTCDNPKCVRPSHLFLGTPGDNHRDMEAKGRMSKGAAHGAKIREARERKRMVSTSAQPTTKGTP